MRGPEVDADVTWQRHLNYWSVKTVVQELCMSHYACNVVIYLLTGRMFRQQLRRLLLCGRRSAAAAASARRRAVGTYHEMARTPRVSASQDADEVGRQLRQASWQHRRPTKQMSNETNGGTSSTAAMLRTLSE